jgi:ABC-type polysaccharide/polyol phosphate export permease
MRGATQYVVLVDKLSMINRKLRESVPVSLPPFWRGVSLFNPVVYLVSGFRWSFYGIGDVSIEASLAFTALFIAVCLAILMWIFRTGYRLRA